MRSADDYRVTGLDAWISYGPNRLPSASEMRSPATDRGLGRRSRLVAKLVQQPGHGVGSSGHWFAVNIRLTIAKKNPVDSPVIRMPVNA